MKVQIVKSIDQKLLIKTISVVLFVLFIQIQPSYALKNSYLNILKFNQQEDTAIYLVVDQPADFNGKGLVGFNNFISDNLEYPENAFNNNETGRVLLEFVVNKDGKLSNFRIIKSSGSVELDQEALRVVRSSPEWIPARQAGKKVRQLFSIPIIFSIKEDIKEFINLPTK